MITVECSNGNAEFALSDLRESKCLRITQSALSRDPLQITACSLPDIDTRSLALFIKLSKLDDSKIFTFIDSLKPDEFKVFDYYAKYLCVYHEFDALFKIKYLKEYGLQDANKDMRDFVDKRYFIFKIVNIPESNISRWQNTNLFEHYCGSDFASFTNSITNDGRAFFALIDFYQETMKKALPITTDHLKDVFNSLDPLIQDQLLKKQLVIVP